MEHRGSMLHSQELSNNPILSRINLIPGTDTYLRSILVLSSHLCLGLLKDLFPVGSPFKILKALLPSFTVVFLLFFRNYI